MLKTSIVGYPRIGSQRELKIWTEDYLKGKLPADVLQENSAALRKSQWQLQRQNGIDFIPSNDFSFYDGILDTACLLGAIPPVYKKLGLSGLDTYFAMARGYQSGGRDVKALPMRKWFNTNYHYIVPSLDDNTEIELNTQKPFDEFKEALALGIMTKPVLTGPFTFLMLAEYQGAKKRNDFQNDIIQVYLDVFRRLEALGCEWIQLDEPSLVMDLSEGDIDLFVSLHKRLLSGKGKLKILLQTYFGDIRDIYKDVASLGFDGIGLDFVEGKKSLDLVQSFGFPKNTLLFAGVVNGKNIWRNDYQKTIFQLGEISKMISPGCLVIGTSCSLLHVPYTLKGEEAMDERYKRSFAFAEEKLAELADLKELTGGTDYTANEKFKKNAGDIKAKETYTNDDLKRKIAALEKDDFIRRPAFAEREKLQKESLSLPLLPTTTIGSFPQSEDLKAFRTKFKKNQKSRVEYDLFIKEKIAECIALQEEIGLDVLVHGEYERSDMVEYFGENLDGFLITEKAWVQSYGTRCVKPPVIWGDITYNKPFTVDFIAFAQSLTNKKVKGMLTGPATILNWSFPREDISNREMAFQIALALKNETAALEAAGIRIIQIDEAALKEKLPLRRADWHSEYLDWAIPAFRLVHSSVKPETQIHTHMCYSEFEDILKEIDDMDADVISFEAARSNCAIVEALAKSGFKTQVGPGVYDIHSPRIPSQSEIENTISTMLRNVSVKKLWVNPDCGLKTRSENEAAESLKNMVAAAKSFRKKL